MSPAAGRLYAWVAAGSALGGLTRYLVSAAWYQFGDAEISFQFPWPTLLVNGAGSLIIGAYFALTGPDGRLLARPEHRIGVMAGFCGGLTTFSIFSLETLVLIETGRAAVALAYGATSIAVWMAAVWIGYAWGTRINRLRSTPP